MCSRDTKLGLKFGGGDGSRVTVWKGVCLVSYEQGEACSIVVFGTIPKTEYGLGKKVNDLMISQKWVSNTVGEVEVSRNIKRLRITSSQSGVFGIKGGRKWNLKLWCRRDL